MNILFICIGKLDIKNWSGTTYSIYENLKKYGKIDKLELKNRNTILYKMYNYLLKKLTKKKIIVNRCKLILKNYKKQIMKKLKENNYDYIFSIGTLPITYVNTNKPIYIYTDGTVNLMENYYNDYTGVKKSFIKYMNECEYNALKKATKIFVSSNWTKNSVMSDYCVDEKNVKMVRIGANFDNQLEKCEVEKIIKDRIEKNCINLLFIGVDWERKGGNKFIKICEKIKERGIKIHVIIAGCKPDIKYEQDIEFYEFLDKNKKEDLEKLKEIYKKATFFVLPTKAECVGVVFCEAASFGLPVISNYTGGIPSLVDDNISGKLFDCNENEEKIADYIVDTYNDKDKYFNISVKAYEKYEEQLNWNSIVKNIIAEISSSLKVK